MSLKSMNTDDLRWIAAAGGGFVLEDAHLRNTSDLKAIAASAKSSGATVILRGILNKSAEDLRDIGVAGKGCVIFADM
jgi:hypothetical protein